VVGEPAGAVGTWLDPPCCVGAGELTGLVRVVGVAVPVARPVALGVTVGDAGGVVAVPVGVAVGVPLPAAGVPDELSLSDPLAKIAITPASAISTLRMPSVRMRGEFGPVGVEAATEFLSAG
jgi:hypothetical protein